MLTRVATTALFVALLVGALTWWRGDLTRGLVAAAIALVVTGALLVLVERWREQRVHR